MKMKASIIVPIYNRSHILAECLGNLTHQTLDNIELILVNDASTDNSLAVMEQCKAQFPHLVRIIDSPQNLGPGGARNLGIEAASGEYIGFVDSDDLADVTMYEKLYQAAVSSGYDVIDCGYYRQDNDSALLHTSDNCVGLLTDQKRIELIVSGGYIFSKLYRRALFEDKQLRFRKNVILEDADFITYLYATIKSIGSVKEILYFYRNEPDSASKIIQTDKYYHNICEAITHIYQKTCSLPNYTSIRPAVEYELLQMYSYGVNVCLRAYMDHENMDIVQMLHHIADLKRKSVSGGYHNIYVQNKIDSLDIEIMQLNDASPEKLLKNIQQ